MSEPEYEGAPAEPQASYDPNDAASVQAYIATQSEAAAEQHIAAWVEQQQEQQQAAQARDDQVFDWLYQDEEGYEERLVQLQIDQAVLAKVQEIREQYAPVFEHMDRVQAEQEAQAQEAALTDVYEQVDAILDDEEAALGTRFSRTEAWRVAEQIGDLAQIDLSRRGIPQDQIEELLRRENFAEAALRSAARVIAGGDGTRGEKLPPPPVQDELAIARRFVQQPRSPGEAIRQTTLERQAAASPALQRELGRMDARRDARNPQSEVDVARNFMDRRRAAEARP